MLLHPERGFGCALLLWMENQPLWCCFDGFVWRLRLLVASVPGSPADGRDGACLPLDLVVHCSSACGASSSSVALWWSPVHSTLPQLKSSRSSSDLSRWLMRDFFLPLLVAPSLEAPQRVPVRFYACPLPLWPSGWRLRSSATAAGSLVGMDGRLSSPPSGVADGSVSCTLDALCIDRNLFPVNPGLF